MVCTTDSACRGENQVGGVDEPARWSAVSPHLNDRRGDPVHDVCNLIGKLSQHAAIVTEQRCEGITRLGGRVIQNAKYKMQMLRASTKLCLHFEFCILHSCITPCQTDTPSAPVPETSRSRTAASSSACAGSDRPGIGAPRRRPGCPLRGASIRPPCESDRVCRRSAGRRCGTSPRTRRGGCREVSR